MRILLLGTAAIALSGCSWLGLGGNQYKTSNYGHTSGSSYHGAQAPQHNCNSSNCLAKWNLEGGLGVSSLAAGTFIDGSGAQGPNANLNRVKYRDAFKPGIRAELGGSYALAPNRKITATSFYETHKGNDVQDLGRLDGNSVVMGFSDYNTYGAELGMRQYFKPTSPNAGILKNLRPYVEGKLGGAYVEPVKVESVLINGQRGIAQGHGARVTKGTWVPSLAGMVGVETPIFRHTTLGLETGVRYTGGVDGDDRFFGGNNPIAGFNNDSSGSWTVPVTLRGRYRF